MKDIYPYAEGNLLEEGNSYAYAPYQGTKFRDAWHRIRQAAIDDLPAPQAAPAPSDSGTLESEEEYDTAKLLEKLILQIRNCPPTKIPENLLKLLERFEISKRIHSGYTKKWRTTDQHNFRNLSLYVRFAEALEIGYTQSGRLDILNGLIKCLDTLCALQAELNEDLGSRLSGLLTAELSHITALERKTHHAPC